MNQAKKNKNINAYYINEPGAVVKAIIRGTVRAGFRIILNVRSKKTEDIDKLDGATILLGNHVSAIDPFVMGAYVTKRWVHYITSSSYFEYPILKKILVYLGAIPKRQGMSDIRSTKIAINILKNNKVVGLFPEGARTIDGFTLPYNNSAAKLIKQTGSNVVISHLSGASISLPRWYRGCSRGFRRGRIDHKAYVLLTKQQVNTLSIEQIDLKIKSALVYNEYDWQRINRVKFHSRSMSEGMHAILHKCPRCLQDYSMRSKGSLLFCNECDNKVLVDTYGFLNAQTVNDVAFNDMIEWRRWQNEYLRKEIDSEDFKMEFFGSLTVKDGYGKVLTVYPESTLTITKNEIKYAYPGGNTILLFHCITDAVSDYSLRFEINQERNSYQFTPLNGQTVIKITDAIKCIKGILQ
ncbi:MAG TPA: lysophospholipid acyltransferase family protein [Clostridia bacterium]|nr:lysophospholipid acyltransferase family protein [Clostridia bacterium]